MHTNATLCMMYAFDTGVHDRKGGEIESARRKGREGRSKKKKKRDETRDCMDMFFH